MNQLTPTPRLSADALASAVKLAVTPPALPGPKLMLMGPSGTGKTHCIGTLVEAGVEVVYFAYEQGAEAIIGYFTDFGKPIPPNLHICTVAAPSASFTEMADAVRNANQLSYEALKKTIDSNRGKYNQLEKFLRSFNAVVTDAGIKLGSVTEWGPGRALVIDGLTGLCDSAMKTCIGGKFDRDQKDWGLAQNMVEGTLRKITSECKCWFVLLAHVERETDPNGGGLKLMASALGKSLAPKLPAMFSDVILTKRIGAEWWWDTADSTADLKTRNLPISGKIPPSFQAILEKWQSRGGKLA